MPQTTTDFATGTDRDGVPRRLDPTLVLLLALTAIKLLLHLVVNAGGGYGIFRDELYYLACASHLDFGYVDHPPLSIWILALLRALIGDSLFALRLLPALAGAALVFVTGQIAREFGGRWFAVTLAALCPLVAGEVLAVSSTWSMNIFDHLLVAVVFLLLVRLIERGNPRSWIWIGALLGLGLLNKVGVLWIGLGVFLGILLSRERRWLATRWPWLGGLLAAVLFSPYLIWNATHEWAHLEFIDNAVRGKYSGLSATSFLSDQILIQNPTTLLVWTAGLLWLLFSPTGRRYRPLAWVWLTACLVLMANGHSKASYLSNAYPALFAAGGVAWERWITRRSLRLVALFTVASGIGLAPLATPILPVETLVAYSQALGVAPSTDEGHELAALPQHYADRFGWRAKAEAVATVYHSLPEAEKGRTVLFGANYGRAGAIDYWSDELDLPPATSNHNSYWWWGPEPSEAETAIILGGDRDRLEQLAHQVEVAGFASCRWCIPYERDLPIYVVRGFKVPLESLWRELRHYD